MKTIDYGYKNMRALVIFDKPVESKDEKTEYLKFRKYLINLGFMMIQYSVYCKFCINIDEYNKEVNKLKKFNIKYGNVRIIPITENQYQNMELLAGLKSEREEAEDSNSLIII